MAGKKVNISFKIDEELYLQFKAVIASYNAEARTRYNVSNELLSHIKHVVESKTLDLGCHDIS